ncbi:hypothetical protein B0H12DRAFT_1305273 [Mycena haematopus]|nr:hypothetical protein B0H12DRAFT_1305273 [Mycena haematopus]
MLALRVSSPPMRRSELAKSSTKPSPARGRHFVPVYCALGGETDLRRVALKRRCLEKALNLGYEWTSGQIDSFSVALASILPSPISQLSDKPVRPSLKRTASVMLPPPSAHVFIPVPKCTSSSAAPIPYPCPPPVSLLSNKPVRPSLKRTASVTLSAPSTHAFIPIPRYISGIAAPIPTPLDDLGIGKTHSELRWVEISGCIHPIPGWDIHIYLLDYFYQVCNIQLFFTNIANPKGKISAFSDIEKCNIDEHLVQIIQQSLTSVEI